MKDITDRFLKFCDYLISQNTTKNATDFAKEVGISISMMTELSKGRSNVGTKAIHNSVIKYHLNTDWLYTGNGSMLKSSPADTYNNVSPSISNQLPHVVTVDSSGRNNIVLLDIQAAAGLPGNLQNPVFFQSLPAFTLPGYIYQQGSFYAIQISGDSMHPTILHSDYVIAKELDSIRRVRNGYIYIVVTLDSVLCKRVYHSGDNSYIEVISDNEIYPMDTIPVTELQRLYEVDSRLSTNLRNYNSDVRRDIAELKSEVFSLKSHILQIKNRQRNTKNA